jgi:hypothetical protein
VNTLQNSDFGTKTTENGADRDGSNLRSFVTFRRDAENDAKQRQIIVRIDDAPASTLMFGETVTVEVPPGSHVLRANNTLFWKRESFSIEPGEHLEFALVNRAGRLTLGFLALIGVAPLYLDVMRRSVR